MTEIEESYKKFVQCETSIRFVHEKAKVYHLKVFDCVAYAHLPSQCKENSI